MKYVDMRSLRPAWCASVRYMGNKGSAGFVCLISPSVKEMRAMGQTEVAGADQTASVLRVCVHMSASSHIEVVCLVCVIGPVRARPE